MIRGLLGALDRVLPDEQIMAAGRGLLNYGRQNIPGLLGGERPKPARFAEIGGVAMDQDGVRVNPKFVQGQIANPFQEQPQAAQAPQMEAPAQRRGVGVGGFMDALFFGGRASEALNRVRNASLAGDAEAAGYQKQIDDAAMAREYAERTRQALEMADEIGLSPEQRVMMQLNPEAFAEQFSSRYGARVLGNNSQLLYGDRVVAENDQPTAPSGYEFDENGGLRPIPGGPADPTIIQTNTIARRRGTVAVPTPPRAPVRRAAPRAAAAPAAPARKPWERNW